MSGHKGYRRNYSQRSNAKPVVGEKAREVLERISDDNPTMKLFHQYAAELVDKQDRFERVVKLTRDATIESKRIIFLLHNIATDIEGKREQIFKEADLRLTQLLEKFKLIALELKNQDHYLYLRAYTFGIQEYIEALCFYEYQRYKTIPEIQDVLNKFEFSVEEIKDDSSANGPHQISMVCPIVEIFLGLADFTGEMMRKCINNLGSGNIEDCFTTCAFVRSIYVGFLGINSTGYNLIGRKLYVLKQSLAKMELVCYNIKVRGSEIPKHMLATVVTGADDDLQDDEGYY